MKKLIVIGATVLFVAAVVYAAGVYHDSQTLTSIQNNNIKDTLASDVIQLQDPGNPSLIPLYRGFAGYVIVQKADTGEAGAGGYGIYDSSKVTINGWWDGVKYPVYTFSQKAVAPDTVQVSLSDTGVMSTLFYYDALSYDIVVTDSAARGANDSLLWTVQVKTKLIER